MPRPIDITTEEIAWAAKLLLPDGKTFDEEAAAFISSLDVIDLQAVPGSGKTTALLAKLLIIGKKLPFEDNGGLLVLSHTNAAVDEIKQRLYPHCPQLFTYPNFVGTIQRFVDEFLAIPCGHNLFKVRITRIDQELYEDKLWRSFQKNKDRFDVSKFLWAKNIARAQAESINSTKSKNDICNELIEQQIKSLYYDHVDHSIKSWPREDVFLKDQSNTKFITLKRIFDEVMQSGIIPFHYAYHLGLYYLEKIPEVKRLLRLRFPFVFVDEMQDMDKQQCTILEHLFSDAAAGVQFQRIGDKNQSIYNSVRSEIAWKDRSTIYPLNGSQRLTSSTASVVAAFAVTKGNTFKLVGLRKGTLRPHLLIYDDDTVTEVIPYFGSLIHAYYNSGQLNDVERYPIKAIAWNTEWKNERDAADRAKIRLVDYFPSFKRDEAKTKLEYDSLEDYLLNVDVTNKALAPIRKNILNGLLKVLRLEGILDQHRRNYTKRSLIEKIREEDLKNNAHNYEELQFHLYDWSLRIIQGKSESAFQEIRAYVPQLLSFFDRSVLHAKPFLEKRTIPQTRPVDMKKKSVRNLYQQEGLSIYIDTVHASKGQTHCATLYLESYYDRFYEIDILANAFLGSSVVDMITELQTKIQVLRRELEALKGNRGKVTKEKEVKSLQHRIEMITERAKMIYVGFSRPTSLLCFAIHKQRFEEHLSSADTHEWVICTVESRGQDVPSIFHEIEAVS